MSVLSSCLFEGTVVHKRLIPRRHAFSYRVFTLCLDLDEIDALDARLRLFSRGRRNFLSFWDADVGEPKAGTVAVKTRALLLQAGLGEFGAKIQLVCYPRLLGYVFNPLSVYFCRDRSGTIGAVIYEVTNTFGERKSYVIPAMKSGVLAEQCAKEMYVSPFTSAGGSYGFHGSPPSERVVIGVNFREAGRPVLKTHFSGDRRPLTDRTIAKLLISHPMMTLKVTGAIHFEAARLWAKGVPIVERHTSPAYSFTLVDRQSQSTNHA